MSLDNERGYYREDFIATKLFERVEYEADFNTVNEDATYTQSPVEASYIRVGPMVYVSIAVDFGKMTGYGTGQYYVTLPFEGLRHGGFYAGMIHEGTAKRRQLNGVIEKDTKRMLVFYLDNQSEVKALTHQNPHSITSSDSLHIEGWYEGAVEL